MAEQTQTKKPPKRAKLGLAAKLLVLALAAALGWNLFRLYGRVQDAQGQKDQLQSQVQAGQAENDKLRADIDAGGTQEQMEELARDELGMVGPGDRVFYDVSN